VPDHTPQHSTVAQLAHAQHNGDLPVLALRPKQAAAALGIGERLLWSKTNAGEIPHVRIGRAVIYPVAALEQWLIKKVADGRRSESP